MKLSIADGVETPVYPHPANYRQTLSRLLIAIGTCLFLLSPTHDWCVGAEEMPNIVLILTDDVGYGDVGWPGKIAPGVSDEIVCVVDLPASLAALSGQERLESIRQAGRSR